MVRADSIPTNPSFLGLIFQETKRLTDAPVKFLVVLRSRGVVVGLMAQKILRIVQQKDINPIPLQAPAGSAELALQKFGVNAMPYSLAILNHFRKRSLSSQGHVLTLNVTGLGDGNSRRRCFLWENLADQCFRLSVGIVRTRVDQVPPASQIFPE